MPLSFFGALTPRRLREFAKLTLVQPPFLFRWGIGIKIFLFATILDLLNGKCIAAIIIIICIVIIIAIVILSILA